jgi:hypothetical protein
MPNKKKPIIHNKFLKAHLPFLKKYEKDAKKREAEAAAHEANMAGLESKAEEFRKDISVAFGGTDGEPEAKKIRMGKLTLDSDSDDDKLKGLNLEEAKKIKEEADKAGGLKAEEVKKIKDEVDKEMKLMEEAEDNRRIKWAINKLMLKKHGINERDSLCVGIHKESKSIAIKFFAAKYKGEDKESKLTQFKKALRKIDLSNIQESTDSISVAMDDLSSGIDRNHEYLKELTKYYKVGAVKYLTDKHDEEYAEDFMEKVKDMAHKRKMRNVDVRPESQPPQQVAAASRVMDLTACDDVRPQQVAAASRVMDLTACDDGN